LVGWLIDWFGLVWFCLFAWFVWLFFYLLTCLFVYLLLFRGRAVEWSRCYPAVSSPQCRLSVFEGSTTLSALTVFYTVFHGWTASSFSCRCCWCCR